MNCESCGAETVGYWNDDAELLCEDCFFEQTCEDLFGDSEPDE